MGHGSGILVDLLDSGPHHGRPERTSRPAPARARALPFLVALSGAAALVYESLWMRSFGLIFGGTTSAVAMVLAVFMGGLALGSALARAPAGRRPAARLRARRAGDRGDRAPDPAPAARAAVGLRRSSWPRAGLTGAAEHARHRAPRRPRAPAADRPARGDGAAGRRVPRARRDATCTPASAGSTSLNTLGGALGVALAPFVLVPALGVRGTLVAAAAASLFVGGVARRWSREIGPLPAARPAAPEADGAADAPRPARPSAPPWPSPRARPPSASRCSGPARTRSSSARRSTPST